VDSPDLGHSLWEVRVPHVLHAQRG
jgi:hypothetical protein